MIYVLRLRQAPGEALTLALWGKSMLPIPHILNQLLGPLV